MARGTTFKVKVRISGVREMQRAFRQLGKDANKELRKQTLALSKELALKIRAAAEGSSGQSRIVAKTVKGTSDRVPSISAGGMTRVGRNKVPAHKVLFGANFGATYLKQFRPHTGAGEQDYWFYRTIEQNERAIDDAWNRVVDEVAKEFGNG
jgi:hypothetical protein